MTGSCAVHVLRVGSPYSSSRRSWPECATYSYRGGEHELLLFFSSPTAAEVEAVRRGPADFALVVVQPVILLLYRFTASPAGLEGDRSAPQSAAVPWSDAPYSWHLVPEAERVLPADEALSPPQARALLHVVLVDATTGIVRALRAVSFSPTFTRALHAAIREQAAAPWDPRRYDAALSRLYASESSEAMARHARVRCRGGE